MRYQFLIETYQTEIEKVLSMWAMFDDGELAIRPHAEDSHGRNLHEQMVHQCVSENLWFSGMLGLSVTDDPLPSQESRTGFMEKYAADGEKRLAKLCEKPESWWEEEVDFFEVRRTRAWVMTRRIAHTAHHRGQQSYLARMLNRSLHSTYGPTADTGGLMQNHAPVIYAYGNVMELLREEEGARRKSSLPGPGDTSPTERPAE